MLPSFFLSFFHSSFLPPFLPPAFIPSLLRALLGLLPASGGLFHERYGDDLQQSLFDIRGEVLKYSYWPEH
jgi:hypothetical protein